MPKIVNVRGVYFKECEVCGWFFRTKKSHIPRRKTCGRGCSGFSKKHSYLGEGNPNYGNTGSKNPMYRGEFINEYGYRELNRPDHPNSNSDGYVLEHRYVMSEVLGRPLEKDEIVHHIDEVRLNNSPDNLTVMSRGEHSAHHIRSYAIIRNQLGQIDGLCRKREKERD